MIENKDQKTELLAAMNAIQNSTGVNFRDSSDMPDDKDLRIVQANSNDPVIVAKYICKDNPDLVKIETKGAGGILYKYNGRYYDFLNDIDLDAMLMEFCIKYNITKSFKNASIIMRALNVYPGIKKIKKINPFDDLISLNNGVLNIKTKEFTPHDPKYYFDYALAIDYDPEANQCPSFVKFLNDIFSGEQDTISNIIRLGGYLLDTSCKAEKCFFFDGNGGSGKSTLINTFTMFFPERETAPVVTSLDLEELSSNGFDKEDLIYSRFNQCAETRKAMYNSEFLKKMVSGDLIKVSRKYDKPFTFRYQGKVVLIGNGLPRFNDTSDGIYRRILIFTFRNRYKPAHLIAKMPYAKKQRIFPIDTELGDKIRNEASAILNLFIEGLLDLRANKYQFIESESSTKAMEEFRRDGDTVREFLEDNYVIDLDNKIPLNQIFMHFREWYMDNVQDSKAMKFRSAEMAKRIKEVFGIDNDGRAYFTTPDGKREFLTVYNLAPKVLAEESMPEDDPILVEAEKYQGIIDLND